MDDPAIGTFVFKSMLESVLSSNLLYDIVQGYKTWVNTSRRVGGMCSSHINSCSRVLHYPTTIRIIYAFCLQMALIRCRWRPTLYIPRC